MKAGDRLRVHDLTSLDHGESVGERRPRDLRDHLVGRVRARCGRDASGEEDMDALVAEAGGGDDGAEPYELGRRDSGFLA